MGTDRKLIAYIGNTLYTAGIDDEFAGNDIGNLANEPVPDFAVMEDTNGDTVLYIADGQNILHKWKMNDAAISQVSNSWDGDTAGEDPPRAKFIEVARDRMWAVDYRYPRRLLWSGLRDGDAWSITQATLDEDDPGFVEIQDIPHGEGITSIREMHGERFVFSQNSIYRFSGFTPYLGASADVNVPAFQGRMVTYEIGAASNHSPINIGADLLFLSRKGVHSLAATEKFGSVDEKFISYPIQPLFETLNKDLFERSWGVNYRRKNLAIWNVSRNIDDGKMKSLLVFDYSQGLWALWTFEFEIFCLGTRIDPERQKEELLAGTDRGYVEVLDQPQRLDDGNSDFTATIQSMWLHGGEPDHFKKFNNLIFYVSSPDPSSITGEFWVDDSDATSFTIDQNPHDAAVIGNITVGTDFIIGGGPLVPPTYKAFVNRRGKRLMFELTCASGKMSVSGVDVEVVPGYRRVDTT